MSQPADYAGAMPSKITRRIASETGIPRLYSVLAEELAPSDLQSLLLEVYRARAKSANEPDILDRSGRNPLFSPSPADARTLNRFDRIAFETAVEFDAVDLSPATPLGTSYSLGGIDQNNVLSTIRNAEVLGDSTTAMAMECARRRKHLSSRTGRIRLCASHRVVRLQPFKVPGFTPHFRLFALVSAGRDTGSSAFEIQQLKEHLEFYLKLFRALNSEGFSLAKPLVEISDLTISEHLLNAAGISRHDVQESVRAHIPGGSARLLQERGVTLPSDIIDPGKLALHPDLEIQQHRLTLVRQQVFDPLNAEYPEAKFCFNFARLEGLGYYTGLCLRVSPIAPDGQPHSVVDGGFTNWTARLLQDRKERLLTSGIGAEFICRACRAL